MSMVSSRSPTVLLALALVLSGCAPQPEPEAVRIAPAPPRDLVAEVRAAGVADEDALEVRPLRDPALDDLRAAAQRHEAAEDFDAADAMLEQALLLAPHDPELLQLRAELALRREEFERAEALAAASFERGPKLGGLCRRNWATVRVAREMRGLAAAADVAADQTRRCTVEPPVRM